MMENGHSLIGKKMISNIENSKLAVVGGGVRCKSLLKAIFTEKDPEKRPEIIGVADLDFDAVGLKFAREKSIFTTTDFKELLSIKELDLVVELTDDDGLKKSIQKIKPPWVLVFDHYEARSVMDYFQVKAKKIEISERIRNVKDDSKSAENLFEEFYE